MLMSFDGYQEVLQEQQEKDKDLQSVKERMASIENRLLYNRCYEILSLKC